MSWNYRIGTNLRKYPLTKKNIRFFSVVSCYYDDKSNPISYGRHEDAWPLMCEHNTFEDLKNSHDIIAGAFKKPILDLDNFPKIYKSTNKSNRNGGRKQN